MAPIPNAPPTTDYEGLLYQAIRRVLNSSLGTPERYESLLDLETLLAPVRPPDQNRPAFNRSTARGQIVWFKYLIAEMGRAGFMGRGKWRED